MKALLLAIALFLAPLGASAADACLTTDQIASYIAEQGTEVVVAPEFTVTGDEAHFFATYTGFPLPVELVGKFVLFMGKNDTAVVLVFDPQGCGLAADGKPAVDMSGVMGLGPFTNRDGIAFIQYVRNAYKKANI